MNMGATQLAKRFLTKDGRWVWVRMLRPKDAGYLVELFEHMGSESRFRRFHQSAEHVPMAMVWAEAEKIVTAVPTEQLGLIAFSTLPDGRDVPVGAARLVWLSGNSAELAMSVRDDWQGQGVGKRMLAMVLEMAQMIGVESVVATMQNENTSIWYLFDQLPYPLHRTIEGTESEVVIDLLGERMMV